MQKAQKITPKAEEFYSEVLGLLIKNGLPFLIGGGLAVKEYTDSYRQTKDMDIFCKAGDYPRILSMLAAAGYKTEVTDERWIAKAIKYSHNADLIFGSINGQNPVDDSWFEQNPTVRLLNHQVMLIRPEELIWTKSYVQNRIWYDGADVNHIILKQGRKVDWKRLLMRMEQHWEILFSQLLNFRFVYPSERGTVPKWLMDEMVSRLNSQLTLPIPKDRVCRGTLLSREDYKTDVTKWEYRDIR